MPYDPGARRHRAVMAAVLFLILPAAGLAREAREEATREFSRTVVMRGGQAFRVEHEQGDVTVRTHARVTRVHRPGGQGEVTVTLDTGDTLRADFGPLGAIAVQFV